MKRKKTVEDSNHNNEDVVIVFVCNKSYLPKFRQTYTQLRTNGKYRDDACLIIGDDIEKEELKKDNFYKEIEIVKFPNIKFPQNVTEIRSKMKGHPWNCNITKAFQWHKLHLLNSFFKKWNYLFYIDSGMSIAKPIQTIIDLKKQGKIVAHSDAYPNTGWKLHLQFDKNYDKDWYQKLENEYDLNCDYFQTGMILLDTNIVTENTFQELYDLSCKYPLSRTNEQGMLALYFTNKKLWEALPTKIENLYTYDYNRRYGSNYIMWKY